LNCRDSNICAFCKHWLGEEPNVEFRTGECRVSSSRGLCAKDTTDSKHKSTDLCHKFSRALRYM